MINKVYTYDTFDRYDYNVKDYTSRYYGYLSKYLQQYPEYFFSYSVEDDEKMENISYKFYKSVDYADLVLAINEDVFLWNVPYNQDVNNNQAELLTKILLNSADLLGINTVEKEKIEKLAKDGIEEGNSLKRNILLPRPEYLSTVLSLIEKYRDKYNLNKKLAEDEARKLSDEVI